MSRGGSAHAWGLEGLCQAGSSSRRLPLVHRPMQPVTRATVAAQPQPPPSPPLPALQACLHNGHAPREQAVHRVLHPVRHPVGALAHLNDLRWVGRVGVGVIGWAGHSMQRVGLGPRIGAGCASELHRTAKRCCQLRKRFHAKAQPHTQLATSAPAGRWAAPCAPARSSACRATVPPHRLQVGGWVRGKLAVRTASCHRLCTSHASLLPPAALGLSTLGWLPTLTQAHPG